MNIYDIYGFTLSVDDSANDFFEKEYWRFKVDKVDTRIDLYVKESNERTIFPTRFRENRKGLYIPFRENENTFWYNPGLSSSFILTYVESSIWWKDKCFLHAGAVSKNGSAIVFPACGGVGKTSMVLHLLEKNCGYLSDDWLIVGNGKAYPLLKTIHVFDYNLKDKDTAERVLGSKRFYYKILFKLIDVGKKIVPLRRGRVLLETLRPTFYVDVQKLDPDAKIGEIFPISKVFFLQKSDKNEIRIGKTDPRKLAEIMALVNLYERNSFLKWYYYYALNYNFRNLGIEKRYEHDVKIMYNTFKRTDTYKISVPDPIDPVEVYQRISEVIQQLR